MSFTIWRLKQALADTGKTRTPWYQDIQRGLMTEPVKIGPRAAGWPAIEVQAINQARIAGKTDQQIRELVERLHEARKAAA